VNLARALGLCWGRRSLILVTSVVAALGGVAFSLLKPTLYDATVTLAVSPSKLGEDGGGSLTPANFRPYIESYTNVAATIEALGLQMTPGRFISKVLAVEEVRNTNLLRVHTSLGDPALSARVATDLANRAIVNAKRVNQEEAVEVRDMIKAQLDEASQRLDLAETRLREFRQSVQIELLRKDVEAKLGQRGDLLKLIVRIESERARLAAAEKERAARQPISVLKRSIEDQPTLTEAARTQGVPPRDLLNLQLNSEYPNDVYEIVDEQVAKSRSELAALEKERSQLVDVRKLGAVKLPELDTLYKNEAALARLQLDLELAQKSYSDIATKYEGSRLQVAAKSSLLQIVDPAVQPSEPNSRQLGRNTALAALAGFTIALAFVLVAATIKGEL
jgi:uncharacterized protein involved in exopolysaccharide biosynthesis